MKGRTILLCVFSPLLALAGQQAGGVGPDVSELSVEELLNTQVTSVSRKAQRLSKAPAAVFVITQEDLRRSGATSIAEALRMVPGMRVARLSGGSWAISARGGAQVFANKLLVMVDGRSVYNNLFGGVFWQQLDTLLEDIDRIEVILGPGGVMWGANAVNGVVNVITRSARRTAGALLTALGGNEDRAIIGARDGVQTAWGGYRVWGKFSDRNLFRGMTPVFRQDFANGVPGTPSSAGNVPGADRLRVQGGFRVDWDRGERDRFTLEGDIFGGRGDNLFSGVQLAAPFSVLTQVRDNPLGGNLQGRWTRTHSSGAETTGQIYFDRFQGQFPFSHGNDVLDLDVQQTRPLNESNELMWGVNFRQSRTGLVPAFQAYSARNVRWDSLFGLVLRDEIEMTPNRLFLSAGIRLEHNNYTGVEYQPSLRILYAPDKRHSVWGAWSRAVRTPTRAEHDFYYKGFAGTYNGLPVVYESLPNPRFRSEKLYAHEAGYRYQGVKWSLSGSLFCNRYTDGKAYLPETPSLEHFPSPYLYVPAIAFNARREARYGGEVWGIWHVNPRLQLQPSYSWLASRVHELVSLDAIERRLITGEDPAHQTRLRSLFDLTRTWQLDAIVYHTSSIPARGTTAQLRLDMRINWRPTRHQEWSVGVFDAVSGDLLEGPPEGPFLSSVMRRAWQMKWVYRF